MKIINLWNIITKLKTYLLAEYTFLRDNLYKQDGSYIFDDTFLIAVLKAYADYSYTNTKRYYNYDTRERTTRWATEYFRAIRDNANMSLFKTLCENSSVGYKYRDVIWVILAAMRTLAARHENNTSGFQDVYELWNVADYHTRGEQIRIINEDPATATVQPEAPVAPATPVTPASDTAQSTAQQTVTPVAPVTPEPKVMDKLPLLAAIGGGALLLFMMVRK